MAESKILDTYRALHPKSAALYERARAVIPGGITHDSRHLKPFPIYVGPHVFTCRTGCKSE